MTNIARHSKGQPAGGQFAARSRTEDSVSLSNTSIGMPPGEIPVRETPTAAAQPMIGMPPGEIPVHEAHAEAQPQISPPPGIIPEHRAAYVPPNKFTYPARFRGEKKNDN
tara:strand:- start:5711 stop:6040 length:330 start_codon:yes stop_codon:yes gene_type:complete